MTQDVNTAAALLAQFPSGLNALVRNLPDFWTRNNEGGDSWSVFDTVAHLLYTERVNWIQRINVIRERGEAGRFDPFDRFGFAKEGRGRSMSALLDDFAALRASNLHELLAMNLGPSDLELRGRHPTFGTVTLGQLIATWPMHDLTHLHQISRVMAFQYREAVGPWTAFLGVMQCGGHSSF